MVIRNKEERTNSIWQFIAVAAIPLLLLFLAGFSLGNTAGKEKTATRQQLEDAEKKIADLEAKLLAQDSFFQRGEAALSQIDAKVDELDTKLREATQLNDVNLIMDWEDEVNKFFRGITRELDNLELDFTADKKSLEPSMKIGLKYFREYRLLQNMRLLRQKENAKSQMETGKLGQLEQLEKDLKKQSEELTAQSKAQQSEATILRLQTQLDKCKEDLSRLNQSAASSSKSPNPAYKAKILTEVDAIRNEILPNMQTTFIGNDSRKIGPLREKLRGKLDIIGQNADRIE